jgi:cellulose synthase/poly-beta-1,6-N-acetylglucosamine synthase-like glycosyltransferase
MMIPILKDYYAAGYLPDPELNSIPPYLPNVNLAVRRKTFDEIGGYDEACAAGEDADLCVRAARAGWAQYYNPSARAFHEPRSNLRALLRQWIWYARGGSRFFFKNQQKRLEIYLSLDPTPKMHRYRRVLSCAWFPMPAMLFISPFVLIQLSLFLGLLAAAMNFRSVGLLFIALGLITPACLYYKSSLRRLAWNELILYLLFACLINWTCIIAGFATGLKKRRIFIYPGI